MKFFHHEPDNKDGFDQKTEQDFQSWLGQQNQRVINKWPLHVDTYLSKLGSMTACRITFRYLYKCGPLE